MGIADVVKALQEERKKDLESHINGVMQVVEEVPPPTVDTIFRVSSLSNMCPREEVLAFRHQVTRMKETSGEMKTAYKIGHLFHDWFRDDVLGPVGMVLGRWACKKCDYSPEEVNGDPRYRQPKSKCPKCGAEGTWTFVEEEFFNKNLGLVGHNDGTLYWSDDYWLLEMKTANNYRFSQMVKSGIPEYYVDQARVYMDMFSHTQTMFIVQNKDSGKRAAFKIFQENNRVQYLYDKIRDFRRCMESESLVPDRMCIVPSCPRAKGCPLVELCFADHMQ